MSYFDCNLSKCNADYLHPDLFVKFRLVVAAVSNRMKRLDKALASTGLDGATFSKLAKVLFDSSFDRFESMTAEEIAEFVKLIDDGKKAPQRMDWPNAVTVVDCAFITTKEWETIRHIGIGGSDAAVVTGDSEYATLQSLYHDKRGTPVLLPEQKSNQALFDRGHILEEKVIDTFCELTGAERIPETRMFASADNPRSTANIDALIQFADGRIFIFEGKTTSVFNKDAWADEKIPRHYVTQMRQYPAVLNDPRIEGTYIGCLPTRDFVVGGNYVGSEYDKQTYVTRMLDRDMDAEQELLERESEYWAAYIDAQVEPDPSGIPDKDIALIRKLTGPADSTAENVEMELTEFSGTVKEYFALDEERKLLEQKASGLKKRQEQLSIPLIEALETSVKGIVDIDGDRYYEVKYAPRGKTVTDMEKLQIAYPEAYSACVTKIAEGSRVFSLKEKKFSKKEKAQRVS